MSLPDLEILKPLVKAAAEDILLEGFGSSRVECKDDGSVVTPADFAMQDRLEAELRQHWPEFDILGEEMSEEDQLSVINNQASFWCIDPLDGTVNYAHGIPFFAVSLGYVQDGEIELGWSMTQYRMSVTQPNAVKAPFSMENRYRYPPLTN